MPKYVVSITEDGQTYQVKGSGSGGSYTGGTGISISGSVINHSNAIVAQSTQALYPIAIDAQGHVTSYGSAVSVPTKVSDLQNDSGYITGITSTDVTTALGYTPYDSDNPDGYITSAGAPVQSVNGMTGNVVISIADDYVIEVEEESRTGDAKTGDSKAVTPNYTPSGDVDSELEWHYSNNKLYIDGISSSFRGAGVKLIIKEAE